jgi:hypothetical protein
MAADDLSPVSLPPVVPAGDTPRNSGRRNPDKDHKNERNDRKHKTDPGPESAEKAETPDPRTGKSREKKPPSREVDFERPEHEFDGFA